MKKYSGKTLAEASIYAQVLLPTEFTDDLIKVRNLFKNESDRAVVILGCSALDAVLEKILKQKLIEVSEKKEKLFDPMGPLGTFSAKIELTYRLGIISKNLSDDINVIRKIRNKFAHNLENRSLEEYDIAEQINRIISRCPYVEHNSKNGNSNPTHRRKFEEFVGSVMVTLNNILSNINRIQNSDLETFLYPHK